jgi:formylglycine-generating enzyme required for sulfatase activity/cytoskeletal protein RodZ
MPEPFDPYHRWLGISPKDQPPNHYRLLGLDHFETHPDVIEAAADQRMAHLKRFNTGKHSALAEKLLNEVAAARICLLNPAKRAIYDQALRQQQIPQAEPAANDAFLNQFQTVGPPAPPRPPVGAAERKTKAKTKTPWIAVAGVAAGVVAVVLILVLTGPAKKGGNDALRAERTEAASKKQNPPPAEQRSTPPPKKQESAPPTVKPESSPSAAKQESTPPAVKQETMPPPAQQPSPPAAPQKAKPPAAAVTPPPQQAAVRPKEEKKEEKKAVVPPKSKKEEKSATTPARLPLPAEEARVKGLAMVHEVYKEEWAKAKTAGEKQALAKKLVEESRQSQGGAVERYALLEAAHELAMAAGDATAALDTAEEISRLYDVDTLDMKLAAVGKMLKAAKTAGQRTAVIEPACAVVEEAARKEKFELARQLGQQLLVEARKTHDSDLMKSAAALNKRIKDQAAAFQQFQEAREKLKSSPEDAAANLAAGKYLCFTKGQWQRGLPFLAKGDDKELQQAAEMETATPPKGGDDQVNLADAWWDLGQSRRGPQRAQFLLHAGSWYEKAEASVTSGLLKSKIDKRLGEIATIEGAELPDSGGTATPAVAPFDKKTALLYQKRWSKHLHTPVVKINSIGMKLVLIPPGEFDMGTPPVEAAQLVVEGRRAGAEAIYLQNLRYEIPQHRVKITRPFYLGVYPVTQGEYQAVIGENPSSYHGELNRPVETVNSMEAIEFCRRLSALPKERAGAAYRLPTEAEWEYACRAGTTTRYFFGDSADDINRYAWWGDNAQRTTHPVGQLRPNPWGLYDMIGNVWQFVSRIPDYRAGPPLADPTSGPGARTATRGGGFRDRVPDVSRSAYRNGYTPGGHHGDTGFRVLRPIGP